MNCDLSVTSPTSHLILQPFRRFTYVTAHSQTLPLLHLRELCSFSNLSVTSPMSQLILQPFRRFTYVTAHSPTHLLLHLRHSSFSNPSFASPCTSQALHLNHLASCPWSRAAFLKLFWNGTIFLSQNSSANKLIVVTFESKFVSFVTYFTTSTVTVYAIWNVLLLVYDATYSTWPFQFADWVSAKVLRMSCIDEFG